MIINSYNYLKKNKFSLFIILIIGVSLGIFGGYKMHYYEDKNSCISKLHFIKPNLDCELYDSKSQKISELQDKLEVLIDGIKKTGKAKRVSVFVRDLNTARFAGVNDGDTYHQASLLKIPLLIGGFKLAEVEPKILDQEIVYSGDPNLYSDQMIKPAEMLIIGKSYTIKELMRRSVVYSDNTAAQLLFDYYPQEFLDRIMEAIGIQLYRPGGQKEDFITARLYANVFRILYNASYLTKEYSDEALSILTKTEYKKAAVAELPPDVVVAHKFAERTDVDIVTGKTFQRQLHECGVVYAEDYEEPYIFCIMTEGYEYTDLEKIISDISLVIYEEMTRK